MSLTGKIEKQSCEKIIFFNICFFIWLHWVLNAALRIFDLHCNMRTLILAYGLQFPDQGLNPVPVYWENGV